MSDNTREPREPENPGAAEGATNPDAPSPRKEGDVYARAGRVAPQTIPAAQNQTPPPEEQPAPKSHSEQEPTAIFDPRQEFDDDMDVPVAPPKFVQGPNIPHHPSDAPTTVFEPQAAEPKRIPTRNTPADAAASTGTEDSNREPGSPASSPAGEPTVMFDAPTSHQNSGFKLPEPDEEFTPAPKSTPYQSTAEQTTTLPPYQQAAAEEQFPPPPAPVATLPPAAEEPVAPAPEPNVPTEDARRGTIDFGIFIIRVVFGLYLIFSAVKVFFQLGGNTGLAGLEAEYANYAQPGLLAVAIPALWLTAGVFLLLGLVTPVAATLAIIGTAFEALHLLDADGETFNLLRIGDGVWLGGILVAIALALQFTGPGRLSLDFGRSWARRPLISSWLFAIIGIAGAVALWWFGAGVNPLN